MLFNVDPKQYSYCGQIQIRKIARTRDNKAKVECILNSFQNRFGRIVNLIMAYGTRINNVRDNTTMAFLQYERSASHAEAIKYFTDENPIIFCGKILKFIPAGFTNEEKCAQWVEYASQRKRANTNGPVYEAPNYSSSYSQLNINSNTLSTTINVNHSNIQRDITRSVTNSFSNTNISSITTNCASIELNSSVNPTIPLELSEAVVKAIINKNENTVICGTCHQTCNWIHYPNHRCAIACKERKEALEVANNIHEKLRTGQRENFVVHFIREKCWLCLEELHTFAFRDIKLMNCGHLMHRNCFNNIATEKGIPMAQTHIELENQTSGEITSCQLIIKEADANNLNHRLVVCEICKKATNTQIHDFSKATFKNQHEYVEIMIDEQQNNDLVN
jgi:hypothetical protein